MENICLDTDILVEFLRGNKETISFIQENELINNLATTQINLFELYYGAYLSSNSVQNIAMIEKLRSCLVLLNLNEESARIAGYVLAKLEKNGRSIDFRDVLIESIARNKGYKIKTNNKRHFNMINDMHKAR